jgi:hypothetical protein
MFKFILMVGNTYFKKIFRLVLLLVGCNYVSPDVQGQIHPTDGDTVNYRMVGFKVPEKKNTTEYLLEIYETYVRDDSSVYTNFLFEEKSTDNKIMATVPWFGKSYKWRVKYLQKGKVMDSTGFSIFSVGSIAYTDTNKYRMRILTNELGDRDYFMFVDGTRTLYDMNGNAIWYLPNIPGVVDDNTIIRDLEMTPFNTITFIAGSNACEIDYDANVLWRAPNDGKVSLDTTEHYHHELTRLNKGTYMVLSSKPIEREVSAQIVAQNPHMEFLQKEAKTYKKILAPTLIEYDKNGNVVWSWLSTDAFNEADLFKPGIFGAGAKANTHMNAFYFNENKQTIYTSHRNINRIVKMTYPSASILAQYGEMYNTDIDISGDGMFYGQHNCRISKNGQLYLFNNNSVHTSNNDSAFKISSVIFFNEPSSNSDTLSIDWEFFCDIDTLTEPNTVAGGGVSELKTGNVLVCMARCRNFIVSKSKQVIWDSIIEQIQENSTRKIVGQGYRSSMIESSMQMCELIYGGAY